MKKIMIALAMVGLTAMSAEAQSQTKQVCRMSSNKKVSCYKTRYAENFPVCKGNMGYAICGETPTYKNSTHTGMPVARVADDAPMPYDRAEATDMQPVARVMTPQSQSIPQYVENAVVPYGASYQERKSAKFCYFGDNVGELNRNPYKGCPAPQYDGPDKTAERAWSEN